jgi:hypothetical protein
VILTIAAIFRAAYLARLDGVFCRSYNRRCERLGTAVARRRAGLPELSRFLGIVVYMVYDDHHPPHFHAEYGDYKITVEVESGVVEGRFPRRALRAVLEWHELHRDELRANWQSAERHQPLQRIPPLE